MRVHLLTPGTGHFFCGSCLRDNALARGLRALGHDVTVTPLYLPHVLEEEPPGSPPGKPAAEAVQMGGINMYLQQKARFAARLPGFVRRALDRPGLLRWASRRGNMTDAADLGAMTVSMVRGEHGRQRHELDTMIGWLRDQPRPDLVVLSNVMLMGLVRSLKQELGCPVVVTCQGEAPFLDALREPHRAQAWGELRERAREVDRLVAVSRTYGTFMAERLELPPGAIATVHNGIDLDGFPEFPRPLAERTARTIGFLARLCRDKGVHTLVDAFIQLKKRDGMSDVRLCLVGVELKEDRALVRELTARLAAAGLGECVEVHTNVERPRKLELLAQMTVLSVPATYGESFGLYLLEAWAAGVPVVQPAHGAFPEVVGDTGGGVLCAADDAGALAADLHDLLSDPARAQGLADAGHRAVRERHTEVAMAKRFLVAVSPL